MAAKVTSVRLTAGDRTEAFEISHAERLLSMENNGGWKVAEDEKLVWTKDGFRPVKDK